MFFKKNCEILNLKVEDFDFQQINFCWKLRIVIILSNWRFWIKNDNFKSFEKFQNFNSLKIVKNSKFLTGRL